MISSVVTLAGKKIPSTVNEEINAIVMPRVASRVYDAVMVVDYDPIGYCVVVTVIADTDMSNAEWENWMIGGLRSRLTGVVSWQWVLVQASLEPSRG